MLHINKQRILEEPQLYDESHHRVAGGMVKISWGSDHHVLQLGLLSNRSAIDGCFRQLHDFAWRRVTVWLILKDELLYNV